MKFFASLLALIRLGLLALALSIPLVNGQTVIKVGAPTDEAGRYVVEMVRLALTKIDTKYKLEMIDISANTQARTINQVASADLDLFWAATDQDLENKLLPVHIPLYKGLFGIRVLIIRKGDQERFNNVKTLEDLKSFKLGQGTTWADTKILEANGLHVVKAIKYIGLFHMLDGERFDAYPRAAHEPWSEIIRHADLNLTVEKRLMLVYRMPFYMFTGPENKRFASDMELGLNRAIADGSFDKIFYSSPSVQTVLRNANLDGRIIIELKNPNLSKETPLDRPELWLDIKDMKNHLIKTE